MCILKIAFYDSKPYDKQWFTPLAKKYGYEVVFFEGKLTRHSAKAAEGYDAVCVFVNDVLSKEVIDEVVKLGVKGVLLRCAGFNNVDCEAAKGKLTLLRVPSYSPEAVAEYTMGLILAVNRKLARAYLRTRDFNYSITGLMGMDLHGKTAGVIGTGRIGQMTIDILKGCKMKVLAYDLYPDPRLDVSYVSLDELLSQSDVITLHCPLTPETKYIINRESIGKMKSNVILVNTSRGGLIHTGDLLEALGEGRFFGVGLDVYEEEDKYFFEDKSNEIIKDEDLVRLTSYPNVLITSHQAFFTKEAMQSIGEITMENAKQLENHIYHGSIEPYENEVTV